MPENAETAPTAEHRISYRGIAFDAVGCTCGWTAKATSNQAKRDEFQRHTELSSAPERWQVRHVESGATVYCRNRSEAEAHVREAVTGPWVADQHSSPEPR